jgi:succinate dehydrogenase/fumarate reductase flavoprotein subunit
LIFNQGPIGKSGLTAMANGGMQWVSRSDNSPRFILEDIIRAGCRLNGQNLIDVLSKEAPVGAQELIDWEAKPLAFYDKRGSGPSPDEPVKGRSFPRAHLIPGMSYMAKLRNKLARLPKVTALEDVIGFWLAGNCQEPLPSTIIQHFGSINFSLN